ncbi:MAG: hypothetical protein AVDCRST_MAG56-2653, partial [uncultured Cytophagales bacterium]
ARQRGAGVRLPSFFQGGVGGGSFRTSSIEHRKPLNSPIPRPLRETLPGIDNL